jgi:transcriptional regulator with XRE-family HTH domain
MSKTRPFGARPSVAVAIAKARRAAGLSQDRLADRLNRCQSYVAKIELGERDVEVREFVWIVRRIGADPLQLLDRLFRDDDFGDLYQPAKPASEPETRIEIEPYDPADEEPDDDESGLGHLTFGPGGAK